MADIKHYIIELDEELGDKVPRCEAWQHDSGPWTVDPNTDWDGMYYPAKYRQWAKMAFESTCTSCLQQLVLDTLEALISEERSHQFYEDEYNRLMNGLKDIQQHMKKI